VSSTPASAEQAVLIANPGGVALTTSITVRSFEGDPFERIIDSELGPLPEAIPAGETTDCNLDDVPF
jgi:hypothetical protein